MRKMLDPDPKLRSSIEEVLEHTWMQSIEVCYMIANPSHVHVHARSLAERQVEDIFELGTRQIQNPPGRPNT
jgi:protein-serine/threonine kinase